MRHLRPPLLRHLLALLLVGTFVAGCSTSELPEQAERRTADLRDSAPAKIQRYVALGDSFTAGPLVPTTDVADGCFRSDGNYPSLVAERLDVRRLVDVSCSGAQTRDLTHPQPTVGSSRVPPQLHAVTPRTDLVTLGIGGNDFDLFSILVQACTLAGRSQQQGDPETASCSQQFDEQGFDLMTITEQISRRVETALRRIQRRAPDARVLLVGYPRLVPPQGRCDELPFADGDYRQGREVGRALNDALAGAADRAGVDFVDVYPASKGHDICSDEPWVNGRRHTKGQGAAYHPTPAEQEAVAADRKSVV